MVNSMINSGPLHLSDLMKLGSIISIHNYYVLVKLESNI